MKIKHWVDMLNVWISVQRQGSMFLNKIFYFNFFEYSVYNKSDFWDHNIFVELLMRVRVQKAVELFNFIRICIIVKDLLGWASVEKHS